MRDLNTLLQQIDECNSSGERRKLVVYLNEIISNRLEYYIEASNKHILNEYAHSLFNSLILELDDEEEDSIEIAELAYLSISEIIYNSKQLDFSHYKLRFLLLHYFNDFFTDTIVSIFLPKYKDNNLLQARTLAEEYLEKMQLTDLYKMETLDTTIIEKDEQIIDACNRIIIDSHLDSKDIEDSALMMKVLYAYIKNKFIIS